MDATGATARNQDNFRRALETREIHLHSHKTFDSPLERLYDMVARTIRLATPYLGSPSAVIQLCRFDDGSVGQVSTEDRNCRPPSEVDH